jgi:hypothetical protein
MDGGTNVRLPVWFRNDVWSLLGPRDIRKLASTGLRARGALSLANGSEVSDSLLRLPSLSSPTAVD